MTIKRRPVSARQKMINLMYVVLMAFLAINVSPEVLGGFEVIQASLGQAADGATDENDVLFEEVKKMNPNKTEQWCSKAEQIRKASDLLYNHIEDIKMELAKEAGRVDGDYNHIENKEDMEAVKQVLMSEKNSRTSAATLKKKVESYGALMMLLVDNPALAQSLRKEFNTDIPEGKNYASWEKYMFDDKPVISAITVLTKIQTDVRYAENKIMHFLAERLDSDEVSSNRTQAVVLPESRTVIRGNTYKAQIWMAAIDTTAEPKVYIKDKTNVRELAGNTFERFCPQAGSFRVEGYVSTLDKSGNIVRSPFQNDYTVIDPTATIAADLMNVLYIGYDNPMSISVPGTRPQDIITTMDGGTLKMVAPGKYVARPVGGKETVIKVYADNGGKQQLVMEQTFRNRRLPEPAPYINIGNSRFWGGRITRDDMLQAGGLCAAVDDGILDVPFKVLSYDLIAFDGMGNAITCASEGEHFSRKQRETLKRMTRGQRMFVTHVKTVGPDNMERELKNAMEIVLR